MEYSNLLYRYLIIDTQQQAAIPRQLSYSQHARFFKRVKVCRAFGKNANSISLYSRMKEEMDGKGVTKGILEYNIRIKACCIDGQLDFNKSMYSCHAMLVRRRSSGLVFSDGDGNFNSMPGPSFLSRNLMAVYEMREQAREEAKWAQV